jgi:hypothetical protein
LSFHNPLKSALVTAASATAAVWRTPANIAAMNGATTTVAEITSFHEASRIDSPTTTASAVAVAVQPRRGWCEVLRRAAARRPLTSRRPPGRRRP